MPFHMTDPTEWWKQMEIMVKSLTELTRMVLPSMQKRNSGVIIINTSSRAEAADLPWAAGYNCAKTAITRFAGILETELNIPQKDRFGFEENGISVFSIHPGEVKTNLHETAFPEKTKQAPYVVEMMDKMAKLYHDFKFETPAWSCVYLCSGESKGLEGRLVDCTRDIEEVTKYVTATPRPRITNACA